MAIGEIRSKLEEDNARLRQELAEARAENERLQKQKKALLARLDIRLEALRKVYSAVRDAKIKEEAL